MKYSLFVFIALLFVTACDKVEVPVSNQEMLRNGRWKLNKEEKKFYNKTEKKFVTEIVEIEECRKDDHIVFRENYDGAHLPGEVLCAASETIEMPFRWGLRDNDTKMYIYDGESFFGEDVNADVTTLDAGQFTITYSSYVTIDSIPRIDTVMHTMTFVKF